MWKYICVNLNIGLKTAGRHKYRQDLVAGLHYAGVDSHLKQKVIAFLVAFLLLVLLPYLHIGEYT